MRKCGSWRKLRSSGTSVLVVQTYCTTPKDTNTLVTTIGTPSYLPPFSIMLLLYLYAFRLRIPCPGRLFNTSMYSYIPSLVLTICSIVAYHPSHPAHRHPLHCTVSSFILQYIIHPIMMRSLPQLMNAYQVIFQS